MSTDKRFSTSERALVAIGVIVPSLVLAGVAINARLNEIPPLVLPQRVMPVPNAHDTLRVAKTQEIGKQGEAETAPREGKYVQPLEDRKALLAANARAIATVRAALEQEYQQPLTYDMTQTFPEYAEDRELARMLAFASHTYADLGNYPEAARCATDAIALGVKIPRGSSLIGMLVGIACEGIGRKALADVAPKLDAATLKATLERLDRLDTRRWPLAETFEVEHLWSQKTIRDLAKMGPGELAKSLGMDPTNENRWLSWRLMLTPKRLAADNNDRYYAKLIAIVKQPYRKAVGTAREPHGSDPNSDPINEILKPAFWQTQFVVARNRTEANLLRARLTFQLTGKPDPRLTDPLGQDQPLKWKKDGGKTVFYSVGPDGDDDGGRAGVPTEPGRSSVARGRVLNIDDEGDLVDGVNTF
ncbi:hypothetical protein [Armatimonas rosea]|uniref:Uncharacterized protein n=1 Tax=Armatimonas rosea TaxID=685828 RepID=A0A7W9W5L3_ARMRO|nr:hypothetical protein [Armatimonas rosea]MBB6048692.1 hypothetical protein [Armatimonas rosea]